MRISIRPNDSGYSLHRHLRSTGKRAIISFNGKHECAAVTADDEAGMLVRYVEPLQVDSDRECIVDEICHGRVEIEIVEEMVL